MSESVDMTTTRGGLNALARRISTLEAEVKRLRALVESANRESCGCLGRLE